MKVETPEVELFRALAGWDAGVARLVVVVARVGARRHFLLRTTCKMTARVYTRRNDLENIMDFSLRKPCIDFVSAMHGRLVPWTLGSSTARS